MNDTEGKRLIRQLREQIVDCVNTTIDLLPAVDEKPTLVMILGTITSELHDILDEQE